MKTAVKTEERAIEILNQWLNDNLTEELLSTNTVIEDLETKCECGTTQGMRAFYEGGKIFAVVAICDSCGDDDNSISDVLNVY